MSGEEPKHGWDLDIIEHVWSRVRVYYSFDGPDLDPDEITRRTGLTPHTTYHAGERMRNGRPRPAGLWEIRSERPETELFAHHVDAPDSLPPDEP